MLPLQLRMSGWYLRPGLRAHFSVPLNMHGGVRGRLKGLAGIAEDSETVRHLVKQVGNKSWKQVGNKS